jgi:uncharacterized membrane protein
MPLFAQEAGPFGYLIPILFVAVVIALLIGVVAMVRKRIMNARDAVDDPMAGFSLSNLRELVKQGKMTPEEYEAAKSQIIAVAQRNTDKNKPAPTDPPVEQKTPTDIV